MLKFICNKVTIKSDSMIQVGELVTLNNDKEYIVINRLNLHATNYVYLMTTTRPLEIIIATQTIENGCIVLKEVKDNEELDYVLGQITLKH